MSPLQWIEWAMLGTLVLDLYALYTFDGAMTVLIFIGLSAWVILSGSVILYTGECPCCDPHHRED